MYREIASSVYTRRVNPTKNARYHCISQHGHECAVCTRNSRKVQANQLQDSNEKLTICLSTSCYFDVVCWGLCLCLLESSFSFFMPSICLTMTCPIGNKRTEIVCCCVTITVVLVSCLRCLRLHFCFSFFIVISSAAAPSKSLRSRDKMCTFVHSFRAIMIPTYT